MLTALLADVASSPWVPTAKEEAALQRAKDDERRGNAPKPKIPSSRWGAAIGGLTTHHIPDRRRLPASLVVGPRRSGRRVGVADGRRPASTGTA